MLPLVRVAEVFCTTTATDQGITSYGAGNRQILLSDWNSQPFSSEDPQKKWMFKINYIFSDKGLVIQRFFSTKNVGEFYLYYYYYGILIFNSLMNYETNSKFNVFYTIWYNIAGTEKTYSRVDQKIEDWRVSSLNQMAVIYISQ